MDIHCGHCGEPWEVYGLRHYPEDYGTPPPQGHYKAVMSGDGCPACGYDHKGHGKHDEQRMYDLVIEGVTDDDPLEFL